MKDVFDAFLECSILADGFLRLRCGDCARQAGRLQLQAPSLLSVVRGARRMAQTVAYLLDHVIPRVPVRQWVLSLPIPLRLLPAAQHGRR